MDETNVADADDNGRPTSIARARYNIENEKKIDINANQAHVIT